MWIIDFGIGTSLEEASLYKTPFEYVVKYVEPERKKVSIKETKEIWWLFQRNRPEMRSALSKIHRYIATPSVSKHRFFVWIESSALPDQQLSVIARDDDFFFGVLHSKPHELWSRAQGSQLRDAESGTRYILTSTFETFPFPWAPGTEDQSHPLVQAIASAAQHLVELRDAWLNPPDLSEAELKKRTLTNLYNARPEWLAEAHAQLDAAVTEAYGWPYDLTDEQILERLLALNLGRAARGGVVSMATEGANEADDE